MRNGHPPFDPKRIFVQKKAREYPLYAEVRERYPLATFEEFEGDHRQIPHLTNETPERFLKTKRDTLILAARGLSGSIIENPVQGASDFMFNALGSGCLFGCVYCYTNLYKLMWHRVAPLTLWANFDELLDHLVQHQKEQGKKVSYEFSCNNDSIAEGNFFSSTAKFIETIAQTENAWGICDTKATNVDYLLDLNHNNRITILMTVSPPYIIKNFEYFTGPLEDRIHALNKLKKAGYSIGVSFSPIILRDNWLEDYVELFRYIDDHLIEDAKEDLIGEAFFYAHRPILEQRLPMFAKHFGILCNKEKYALVPKGKGVFRYRELDGPIESFRTSLQETLPYLELQYINP